MNRCSRTLVLSSAILALAGCSTLDNQQPARRIIATATLLDPGGAVTGNATIAAIGDRYDLEVEARNITPGPHGLHLHTVGRCQPRDFSSAGGHLNPFNRQHGALNPAGSHLGDIANMEVAADGSGKVNALLDGTRQEIEARVFDEDGTAIVLHAGPDDYRTDPSGSSGGRIACGVFARVR